MSASKSKLESTACPTDPQSWPVERRVALVLEGLRAHQPVTHLCRQVGIPTAAYPFLPHSCRDTWRWVMTESRFTSCANGAVEIEPLTGLERMYMEEYLKGQGHTLQTLQQMPEQEAKRLMAEASAYASTKLAEVETRAQFVQDIHGVFASGS